MLVRAGRQIITLSLWLKLESCRKISVRHHRFALVSPVVSQRHFLLPKAETQRAATSFPRTVSRPASVSTHPIANVPSGSFTPDTLGIQTGHSILFDLISLKANAGQIAACSVLIGAFEKSAAASSRPSRRSAQSRQSIRAITGLILRHRGLGSE